MADPESLRQITRSRAPFSTWLGVVLLFVFFGVLVLAVIGPSPRGNDYEEMHAKKRMENLKTAREDAEKSLNAYAWIDKNKGTVRIPISRAMELTVAQLAQQKPAAAGPIATPASAEATAGKPAAQTAAAFASPSPAAAPKPGAAQPVASPSSAPASASPAAQSSPPPAPASQAPAKTP